MSKKHPNDHAQNDDTPTSLDRRKLLARGGIAAGGMATFVAGYGDTLHKAVKGLASGTAGEPVGDALRGNSLKPEFMIDASGNLSTNNGQIVSPSSCLGCWTQCGVRVRVDTENNRILRIAGNPYHPLATTNPAPMDMPVRQVYAMLGGDNGLEGRATSCARGSSMMAQVDSPYRVLAPLKRVGPRGSGKWETIAFEQMLEEVCEGGDLFGEGHVDGLRAVFDQKTLIDPENPEYGPVSNQLVVNDSANEGRSALVNRFAQQSFGTVNRSNHGSYCGQSRRIGAAAALGDLPGMPHGKPHWTSARFGLFIGAAPAQSGNPFQRQGRELATARSRKDQPFRYVVVSPILPTSSSLASGSGNRWIGVKPGSDLALCMAMIDWIIEHNRYDATMLSQPGAAAAKAAEEAAWTNATHLLITQEDHPRFGTFVRGADLGWALPEATEGSEQPEDVYVVQLADGSLSPHTVASPAQLLVEPHALTLADGTVVQVSSSFVKLREEAARMSRSDYADICGIPVQVIEDLAHEFTSYGKQAVTDMHGGTMNGAGFYTAYAIYMLNTLVGNLNVKGGLVLDAGPFGPFGPGPRYNFAQFPGRAKPTGVPLSRSRFPYEKTSEYKRKLEQHGTPYPAAAPWYPAVGALSSEMLASGLLGYPYPIKIWLNHMSNPVYAMCGFKNALLDKLKDPKVLPLHISVNAFINETSAWADYIVPDTITYESWGIGAPWADVIARSSTVRWPTIKPAVAQTAKGDVICLETFLIEAALRLEMPGFGKGVIKDSDGNAHDLMNAEDFYLRGLANMAYATGRKVGEASDDDMLLTGVNRYAGLLQERLKPEEWRRVAMLMTRGGRFDDLTSAWNGDQIRKTHTNTLNIWSEQIARMRHSMTGEHYSGCPTYYPTRLGDGTPMREKFNEQEWPMLITSYKSNLMSSMSIGVDRLRQLHPHNPVSINRTDAMRLEISNGDPINIITPGGKITGVALVREGIMPGAIAIEHGYGHTELGAASHTIDGKATPHNQQLSAGVNLNELGFADPSRGAHSNVWIDWVSGSVVRQGLPARIEPVRT
ncbi:tetrathionate reductase subunit TtrA [Pollutimonas subterranea]|uniref:Tetrathionate reductase subunit TtrA n=1 Tax=Pollutimonas subterranea TaxID=2045210 RepID=A0A2N4U0Z7_9BURK|nr:tetrathionate reductase subunit A [Pollutimonas subterranea]PLC48693.1 tetrathionate reductase subunit TtrA [Pollutimonas subterranea]